MKKIGLALGGGGARGCAHLGVIRGLQEAGFPIACIAGTSIGAVIGAVYASGDLDRFEEQLLRLKRPELAAYLDPTLPFSGLFKGDKIVALLEKTLSRKTFRSLDLPLCVLAADLERGREVRLSSGRLIPAVRASMAIPGIFTPVKNGRRYLVDGGLLNPLPVDACRELGAELVIAVDLSHNYRLEKLQARRKHKSSGNGLLARISPEGPSLIEIIESSIFLMQKQISTGNLARHPADLLLRPRLRGAGIFDFHLAAGLIKAGRHCLEQARPELGKLMAAG